MKNPLKSINILFSIISLIYVLLFTLTIAKEKTLGETIASQKTATIGLCLSVSFIVCYFQKNIIAWWIAILFVPIMFICKVIIKGGLPDNISIFAFVVVGFLTIYYLRPKYAIYKEYLKSNDQSTEFDVS
jgi:hypothetical protein